MVRAVGIEPTLLAERDFESRASTNSTTPALVTAYSAATITRNGKPERDDVAMQGRAGGFLRFAGLRVDPRCLAMKPILLHLAGRDVFKRRIAKEWQEINVDDVGLRFHISGIALAQCDDLELVGEGRCGILETGTA